MHLDPFELHRPATVEEAYRLFAERPGAADYLAGGTDLLPNYKMHLNLRPTLISLDRIPELSRRDGARIGAMVRLGDLERDPEFLRHYPGVARALREIATPLVRATASVGGNLLLETRCFFFNQSEFWRASLGYCLKADGDRCHVVPQKERCYATFSGDLAPALAVLDADVEIAGPDGRRTIPLIELYDGAGDGIRRTRLAPGEIVTAVVLPADAAGQPATYRKLRVRPSFDFPELGVAVAARFSEDRVARLRIAIGGLETCPRRFDAWTTPLEGLPLDATRIREIAAAVQGAVRPVHNTFLPPDYRRRMVGVYVRRALTDLVGAAAAA